MRNLSDFYARTGEVFSIFQKKLPYSDLLADTFNRLFRGISIGVFVMNFIVPSSFPFPGGEFRKGRRRVCAPMRPAGK